MHQAPGGKSSMIAIVDGSSLSAGLETAELEIGGGEAGSECAESHRARPVPDEARKVAMLRVTYASVHEPHWGVRISCPDLRTRARERRRICRRR